MGRTLPSITQAFLAEQQSLARFRRALRREDQMALDELLANAQRHLAAAAYASHLLPFETMLLAMLVEQRKEFISLRHRVEALEGQPGRLAPELPDQRDQKTASPERTTQGSSFGPGS